MANIHEGIEITLSGFGYTKHGSILNTKDYKIDQLKELLNDMIEEFVDDLDNLDIEIVK